MELALFGILITGLASTCVVLPEIARRQTRRGRK